MAKFRLREGERLMWTESAATVLDGIQRGGTIYLTDQRVAMTVTRRPRWWMGGSVLLALTATGNELAYQIAREDLDIIKLLGPAMFELASAGELYAPVRFTVSGANAETWSLRLSAWRSSA